MNSTDSLLPDFNINSSDSKKIALEKNPFGSTSGQFLLFQGLVLSFAILAVNLLTVYIMWTTPSLRTIQSKYIMSLSFADSLVGFDLIELFVIKKIHWDCQLTVAILHSSVTISMLTMVAIAVDRYIFIAKPFFHMRMITHRVTTTVNIAIWVLGLANGISLTFIFGIGKGKGCHPFFTLHHTILSFTHLGQFTINILVTGILYGLIARIAKKMSDKHRKNERRFVTIVENVSNNDDGSSEKTHRNFFSFGKRRKVTNDPKDNPCLSGGSSGDNTENIAISNTPYSLSNKYETPISMLGVGAVGEQAEITTSTGIGTSSALSSDGNLDVQTTTTTSSSSSSSSSAVAIPTNRQAPPSHSFRWLKQMVTVFGLFVLCWAPSLIATVLHLLGVAGQDPIYILSWFGIANSGVNFFIYSFMNAQFRKALKQKFKNKCGCCNR